eukprot:639664-Heterocapsa_arctica.AAC.1
MAEHVHHRHRHRQLSRRSLSAPTTRRASFTWPRLAPQSWLSSERSSSRPCASTPGTSSCP